MLRIRLLWVGKTREPFIREGIRLYEKKLKAYVDKHKSARVPRNYTDEDGFYLGKWVISRR